MTYTDQATVEDFLKRSLSADEQALLPLILSASDSYIDSQVGGSFGAVNETTRYYDGGSRIIDIDTCHSVSSVNSVDSSEVSIYEYDLDDDIELRPRNETYKKYIESRVGKLPSGVANIAVTAKFTESATVPNDIKYLATYLAGQLFSSNIVGNIKSESIEGYSRTFADLVEQNQVIKMILDNYTKDEVII